MRTTTQPPIPEPRTKPQPIIMQTRPTKFDAWFVFVFVILSAWACVKAFA